MSDNDNVIDRADKLLGGVVEKIENNQQPRTDLTCPCSNSRMVYDNRHDKKSDKSPDFVCSGRTEMNVLCIQVNGVSLGG